MKADFSRGFNPDDKRGKRYRRVLLQQGRVLLDSDAVANVEATDRLLREEARDLGTQAGGLRRGFLITAGHLLCLFDEAEKIDLVTPLTSPDARRIDYNRRFRERFPSLAFTNAGDDPVSITVTLERPHDTDEPLVLWLAADADSGTTVGVTVTGSGGGSYGTLTVNIAAPPGFFRFQVNAANPNATDETLTFQIDGHRRIWIGLIETGHTQTDVDPGPGETLQTQPFWIQSGRYHIGGLMVESNALGPETTSPGEIPYPEQGFPRALGFDHQVVTITVSQAGVAYLEAWERLITALHDPGIRENALSATLDTSVRTQAIGQVKTFVNATGLSDLDVRAAFANHFVPNGELEFATQEIGSVADPCGITPEGGFTGRENHLYHFEIHEYDRGTGLGRIKWSREAGSELFGVVAYTTGSITVPASSSLRDGDIVELLNDEVELGDAAPGFMEAGQFFPPRRQVGVIAQLHAQVAADPATNEFALFSPDDADLAISLDARYQLPDAQPKPAESLRVRRWHGFPAAETFPTDPDDPTPIEFDLENGLLLRVAGTFEVGDWWQFEARFQDNAFTPVPTRHGPERLFSPLALLGRTSSSDLNPDAFVYLDEPLVPAAELDADHIGFDPIVAVMSGSTFDSTLTLQAMLDHLILFAPGQTISSRITHIWPLGPVPGTVTGNWQLSIGDGQFSFGDFNEGNTNGVPNPSAIEAALNFVRTFSPPEGWTLRLLVKRGTYAMPAAGITINGNERLILEGEGIHLNPAAGTASIISNNSALTTSAFYVSGSTAYLELRGIVLQQSGGSHINGIVRQEGQIKLVGCRLVDQAILVLGTAGTEPPNQDVVVVEDCEFGVGAVGMVEAVTVSLRATDDECGGVTLRGCRAEIREDAHFVGIEVVGGATTGVRLERLTIADSAINLTGSQTDTNATKNAGLLQVRTSTAPDAALTIRDILFENCNVRAGTPDAGGTPGVLLQLASGNDPGVSLRVNRIDHVVIRGGRWTIVSDTQLDNLLYIGNNTFTPGANVESRILRATIEDLEIGWEAPAPVLYGSKFAADHTALVSADEVHVKNVRFFGTTINSTRGELAINGRRHATVDGLRLSGFAQGGVDSDRPISRVRLYSSGRGVVARAIEVVGDFSVVSGLTTSLGGMVEISSGGDISDPSRVAVLTGCRVSDNRGGAGFISGTRCEFTDCFGVRCQRGLVTANASVVLRGGFFIGNLNEGILITVSAGNTNVLVEGATVNGNNTTGGDGGIVIVPAIEGNTWDQRGPTVANNRVFDNGIGTTPQIPQISLGAADHSDIGGACFANSCAGGTIQVGSIKVFVGGTSAVYYMRGLGTQNGTTIDVWASKARLSTPATAQLLFNNANWERG